MIADVSVLYGATIVHPGKRREEEVLLAAVIPVRIPALSPSAGRAISLCFDFLDQTRRKQNVGVSWLESSRRDPPPWMGEDGRLYAPKRVSIGKAMSRPLTIEEISGLTAMMVTEGNTLGLRPEAQESDLLQTRQAMSASSWFSTHGKTILPETTPFRSMTPVVPGARDIAIAHAASRARQWRCDPLTREVFTPSIGPLLEVSKGRIDVSLDRHDTLSLSGQVRFRIDQFEEAMLFHRAVHACEPETERFTVCVERPAEYAQDWSEWNVIAFANTIFSKVKTERERNGPHIGMEEAIALKAKFHAITSGIDQSAPPPDVMEGTLSILQRMGELSGPRTWLTGYCEILAEPVRRFVDYEAAVLAERRSPADGAEPAAGFRP